MSRRKIDQEVKIWCLAVLKEIGMASIDKIRMETMRKFEINISWNTLEKYLNELVESGRIQKTLSEPTRSRYKKGRVFYFISEPRIMPIVSQSS